MLVKIQRKPSSPTPPESEPDIPHLAQVPARGDLSLRVPVASTGVFGGAMLVLIFTQTTLATLFPGIIFVACMTILWFIMNLGVWAAVKEWKQWKISQRCEDNARSLLGDPYERWKVYAHERSDTVEIQQVCYRPQHRVGQEPDYKAEIIQSREFYPEQEVEALEALGEWQAEAEEKEAEARDRYEAKSHLAQSTNALTERLQAQLPKAL